MKKRLCLCVTAIIVLIVFAGCTSKGLPTSVVGQWQLETISSSSGELLMIGKTYPNYDDSDTQKEDVLCEFYEDGTFKASGLEELQGRYNKDEQHSTADTIAVAMTFEDKTQAMAVYGIRRNEGGEEVDSLSFTFGEKIYSFLR